MKILDYEGLKQVVSKIKGLIDKKADKSALEKLEASTKFVDTKDANENPLYYLTNHKNSIVKEKKTPSSIGLDGKIYSQFCWLITINGSDTNVGFSTQFCMSDFAGEIYTRSANGARGWSSWSRILNDGDLRLKLSQLIDDSTHRLVTDDEKAKWNNKAEKSFVDSSIADMENKLTISINRVDDRLKQLESALYEDITSNPFTITFSDINGLNLTNGVFNQYRARLEC